MTRLCLRLLVVIILSLCITLTGSVLFAWEGGHSHGPTPGPAPSGPPARPPAGPPTSPPQLGGGATFPGGPPSLIYNQPGTRVEGGTPDLGPKQGVDTINVYVKLIQVVNSNDARIDTVTWRVPRGQSCVEASEHRAQLIAAAMRESQRMGNIPKNHSIIIGRVSGYNVGIGSLHTYNVTEINDQNGNVVKSIEVDNYVTPLVIPHGKVNWADHYNQILITIPAKTR
jgi:hypothetical protein